MPFKIVVGLDGNATGDRALAHAKKMAKLINASELIVVHVIEWSPYAFQTAEENAVRGKQRKVELAAATSRIIDPAVAELTKEGFKASGIVRHGDVADLLNTIAVDAGAEQIIVARTSEGGLVQRMFGSSTVKLVTHASVPVTVVV